MRAKRIIPCLDVKDGRVVKGVGFVDLRDTGDPVELAKRYDADGADEITLLDIAASTEGRKTTLDLVARIRAEVRAPLIVGGGISTIRDIREVLDAGASKVSINTAAVRSPELVAEAAAQWGSAAVIVAIDARRYAKSDASAGWEVCVRGGAEGTGMSAVDWAARVEGLGAGEILVTSVDRDGTRDGYDLPLLRALSARVSLPIIASGGVGTLQHLYEGLVEGLADAALAASIFHEGRHTIREARAYLASRGISMQSRSGT